MQVRQLRMAAGLMAASGNAEADSQGKLSGRLQVELRAQAVQARAGVTISGTLKEPQFKRGG